MPGAGQFAVRLSRPSGSSARKTCSTRERIFDLALLARRIDSGMEQGHPGPERNESLPQPIKDIASKAQEASVGNASSCVCGDCSWLEQSARAIRLWPERPDESIGEVVYLISRTEQHNGSARGDLQGSEGFCCF